MQKITYTRVGDYYLPDIKLSDPPGAPLLGRYGKMHKEHLRKEKPTLYASLLLSEKLYPLCREVDEAAEHRLKTIADHEIAHEIILSELVSCTNCTLKNTVAETVTIKNSFIQFGQCWLATSFLVRLHCSECLPTKRR